MLGPPGDGGGQFSQMPPPMMAPPNMAPPPCGGNGANGPCGGSFGPAPTPGFGAFRSSPYGGPQDDFQPDGGAPNLAPLRPPQMSAPATIPPPDWNQEDFQIDGAAINPQQMLPPAAVPPPDWSQETQVQPWKDEQQSWQEEQKPPRDQPAISGHDINGGEEEPEVEEVFYNDDGLPIRPGMQKCGSYLRQGVCNYGSSCRFDHPAGLAGLMAGGGGFGEFPGMNSGSSMCEGEMPRRPGKAQCSFLQKTGKCPFGPECRFDHSTDADGKPLAPPVAVCPPAKKKDSGLGGVRGRRQFPAGGKGRGKF